MNGSTIKGHQHYADLRLGGDSKARTYTDLTVRVREQWGAVLPVLP